MKFYKLGDENFETDSDYIEVENSRTVVLFYLALDAGL